MKQKQFIFSFKLRISYIINLILLNTEPEKSVPFSAKFEKLVFTEPSFMRNNVIFFLCGMSFGRKKSEDII